MLMDSGLNELSNQTKGYGEKMVNKIHECLETKKQKVDDYLNAFVNFRNDVEEKLTKDQEEEKLQEALKAH